MPKQDAQAQARLAFLASPVSAPPPSGRTGTGTVKGLERRWSNVNGSNTGVGNDVPRGPVQDSKKAHTPDAPVDILAELVRDKDDLWELSPVPVFT